MFYLPSSSNNQLPAQFVKPLFFFPPPFVKLEHLLYELAPEIFAAQLHWKKKNNGGWRNQV